MLISEEIIQISTHNYVLKTYIKKTSSITYRLSKNVIKITIPYSVYKQGKFNYYKNEMLTRLAKQVSIKSTPSPHIPISERNTIIIMGIKFYITKDIEVASVRLSFEDKRIYINSYLLSDTASKLLAKTIAKLFQNRLEKRVAIVNKATINKSHQSISLKNNQSTWGMCTGQNHLIFSVNLLFTPLWVIDYVIVHELCHIIHKNHSKDFWNLVAIHFPKYKEAKHFLKQ